MLKVYKYRLYPCRTQEKRMFQVLAVCRHWYNMCLEERKLEWELKQRSVSKNDQIRKARLYRQTFPQAHIVFSQILQSVAGDLDKAFDAFFRRVKAGEKPGYPRFKSRNHFHSFNFPQFGKGAKVDGRRLKLFGIGRVRVRWHREIPEAGTIKTCRIKHQAGLWFVSFVVELPDTLELPKTGRFIGVDMGISALITTSEGERVENPNYYREGQKRLRVLSRVLARKKKGGQKRCKAVRRVQRQHLHVANQRSDYLHKLSTKLAQSYDGVAMEGLATRNMVKNSHLSKSILDSGWAMFKQYLTYKAGSAGREIRLVNPAYTSKYCSNCGEMFQDFDLSTRWVNCACGLSLDRDHNAAINILSKAGWDAPAIANVAPLSEPKGTGKGKRRIGSLRL
jgi:putative transposase